MRANKGDYITIKLNKLELNEGQLTGVPKNPRFIHDDKFEDLKQSIKDSPEFLRANTLKVYPLKNGNYIVIGGNMRLRACKELQMHEVPCYVFPKSTTKKKLREYALKDNMAYGQTNWEDIANEWKPEELKEWAFDIPKWEEEPLPDPLAGEEGKQDDNNYKREIVTPVYEPTGEDVPLSECYNMEKTDSLLQSIDEAEIPADVKSFLRVAAYRHTAFNYERVADYYANAPKEVQQLMEESALVIIDFNKAVENGFVKITRDFLDEYGKEYGDDEDGLSE